MHLFVPATVISADLRRLIRERRNRNKRKYTPAKWKPRRRQSRAPRTS